jgi:hypothetical protein
MRSLSDLLSDLRPKILVTLCETLFIYSLRKVRAKRPRFEAKQTNNEINTSSVTSLMTMTLTLLKVTAVPTIKEHSILLPLGKSATAVASPLLNGKRTQNYPGLNSLQL